MLSLTDKRWTELKGGYRTAFDPRPALHKLESNVHAKEAWHELWEGLHHQGDVGEASYAAVPHIVGIYRRRQKDRWRTFGLIALIELARGRDTNPKVPSWLNKTTFKQFKTWPRLGLPR
jgi:hypothetical protein